MTRLHLPPRYRRTFPSPGARSSALRPAGRAFAAAGGTAAAAWLLEQTSGWSTLTGGHNGFKWGVNFTLTANMDLVGYRHRIGTGGVETKSVLELWDVATETRIGGPWDDATSRGAWSAGVELGTPVALDSGKTYCLTARPDNLHYRAHVSTNPQPELPEGVSSFAMRYGQVAVGTFPTQVASDPTQLMGSVPDPQLRLA